LKVLQTIFSLVLIPLLLLSSTGIRISQHWCGDNLINTNIWGEAEACAHSQNPTKVKCPIHGEMLVGGNCCNQQERFVEGGDTDFESIDFIVDSPIVLALIRHSDLGDDFCSFTKAVRHFLNHSPPLITTCIFLRVQSFLL
jgi:hypothetical protein